MSNSYIKCAELYEISDYTSALKLLSALHIWANEALAGKDHLSIIDIAYAPNALYKVLDELRDVIFDDPQAFKETLNHISVLDDHPPQIFFGDAHTNVNVVTEILRAFITFEKDGTVWTLKYVHTSDDIDPGNFDAGIAIIDAYTITNNSLTELYDRFVELGSVDDRVVLEDED